MTDHKVLGAGEMAASCGVTVRTVARWDGDGLLVSTFRTPGGHRRFRADEAAAIVAGTHKQYVADYLGERT